jgi:hypothetical protein
VRRKRVSRCSDHGQPVVGLEKTGGGGGISTRTKVALITVFQRINPLKSTSNVPFDRGN